MFSCQNTDFDRKNAMDLYTENWSYGQGPESMHYQDSPTTGTSENEYSPTHIVWAPGQPIQDAGPVDQNFYLEPNHFHNDYFIQDNSTQYTPLTPELVSHPVLHLPRPCGNKKVMAKNHRAIITFESTRTGYFKAIVKRKRKRTIFTRKQVETLEEIFKNKQYITRKDREVIVNQLQLNDKAVKIWFQNRRLKDKKVPEQSEEDVDIVPALEERSSPNNERLDYVESKINEKTDQFGYVTLDESVTRDLFSIIDDFLTNGPYNVEDMSESNSSPVYEPISPASASDNTDEENSSRWRPSKPNESLQRLFDLQAMLSL